MSTISIRGEYEKYKALMNEAAADLERYDKLSKEANENYSRYKFMYSKYKELVRDEIDENLVGNYLYSNAYFKAVDCGCIELYSIVGRDGFNVIVEGVKVNYVGGDYSSENNIHITQFEERCKKKYCISINDIVNGCYDIIDVTEYEKHRSNIGSILFKQF